MKASIPHFVLGSFLGSLTVMLSIARAAEPEVNPLAGTAAPAAPQGDLVTVDQAPGVDLPPQIGAQVRAAIEDTLAGRARPGVPIDVTLEADGVDVRVGSLSRRIAIVRWDYTALRTVALHVLDLLQPAPESPEILPANPIGDPTDDSAAPMVVQVHGSERPAEHADESGGPWSVHASLAGARGAQGPDPWMASVAVGAAWTHGWKQIGEGP